MSLIPLILETKWVDLRRTTYMNEPFIMASQAKKNCYVTDPYNNVFMSIALQRKYIVIVMEIKI